MQHRAWKRVNKNGSLPDANAPNDETATLDWTASASPSTTHTTTNNTSSSSNIAPLYIPQASPFANHMPFMVTPDLKERQEHIFQQQQQRQQALYSINPELMTQLYRQQLMAQQWMLQQQFQRRQALWLASMGHSPVPPAAAAMSSMDLKINSRIPNISTDNKYKPSSSSSAAIARRASPSPSPESTRSAMSSAPVKTARRSASSNSPVFNSERLAKIKPTRRGSVASVMSSTVGSQDTPRYCSPCAFVSDVGPEPLTLLKYPVQRRFTVNKKDCVDLSDAQQAELVDVSIRVMGKRTQPMSIWDLYVVAKDICLLVHVRKGNVAKTVAHFDTGEKARMRVQCPRAGGEGWSEHEVLVLPFRGVRRLLTNSRSPNRHAVLEWITRELTRICESCDALDGLSAVANGALRVEA